MGNVGDASFSSEGDLLKATFEAGREGITVEKGTKGDGEWETDTLAAFGISDKYPVIILAAGNSCIPAREQCGFVNCAVL